MMKGITMTEVLLFMNFITLMVKDYVLFSWWWIPALYFAEMLMYALAAKLVAKTEEIPHIKKNTMFG